MDTIRGELVSFRVRGSDFWGVGVLRALHDGGEVTIVGKLVGAREGDTLEVSGEWTTHARWGRQFQMRSAQVVLPRDVSGVVGWLAAKLPQISRRRAELLVERHGVDELWKILDLGEAGPLCEVDGITPARAEEILAAYREHKEERDRMVRFKQWGLTDAQVARVLEEWGSDAEQRIQDNPYQLMDHVHGFGWERADQVARKMGVARDAPPRLAAGLMHVLREAIAAGNVYVSQGKLVAAAANKICEVGEESVREALDGLLARGRLVRMEQKVYLPNLAAAEGRLAKVFAGRSTKPREARDAAG